MTISLLALSGAAVSALAGLLPALLAALFALGVSSRISQVAATLAGTHGPVAARSEGTASALLTASLPRLAATGAAVAAGIYLRTRRNRRAVDPVGVSAGAP